jgi:hypothetical protein
MGYVGLHYLINIANQDFNELTNKILDHLSRTEIIITELIIPTLLFDINENVNPKQKDIALAALNRLNGLISSEETLHCLKNLIFNNTIDKRILISTLRAAGAEGERILV